MSVPQLIGFEYLYKLGQDEVIFEPLNEIARCTYLKGQVEFTATPQKVLLVMCYEPIRFGVDCLGQYECVGCVANKGLGCFYLTS